MSRYQGNVTTTKHNFPIAQKEGDRRNDNWHIKRHIYEITDCLCVCVRGVGGVGVGVRGAYRGAFKPVLLARNLTLIKFWCIFNYKLACARQTYNKTCDQQRLRSPVHPTSMASVLNYPSFDSPEAVECSCDQRRLWSDCADAQADLSLRWSHKFYCRFCRALGQSSQSYMFGPHMGPLSHLWNITNTYNQTHWDETKQRIQWRSEARTQENRKQDPDAPDDIQSNLNGSNIFETMKIRSRHG